jgi:hypothetical protein
MSERRSPRLLVAPKRSFFLFGPRGTGKSTWVRTQLPDAHRVDLLDEALCQSYLGGSRIPWRHGLARARGPTVLDRVA